MSDKAVITGTSTLGKSMQEVAVEIHEQSATETTTSPATNEPSTTSVTPEGNLQEIILSEVEQPPVEENVGTFDINFGEENSTQDEPAQQTQTFTDWKAALKSADRKEILKELGISEFADEINEHIKKGGKPADYITAKGINWNEVPDLDLVRADFDAKYPNLTKEEKAYLFNKKYVANIDIDDEEIVMSKGIDLKTAAYDIRQKRIAEQQSFKIPEVEQPEQDADYISWKQSQQELNTHRESFKNFLSNHEATKNLLQNKRVAIKVDDKGNTFNFGVNKPEAILNALTDGGNTWRKLMNNAQGEPDIQKQHLVMLFASDPERFVGQIFNYGKMQGVKQKVTENSNPLPPSGTQPRNEVTTTEREAWKNAKSSKLGLS